MRTFKHIIVIAIGLAMGIIALYYWLGYHSDVTASSSPEYFLSSDALFYEFAEDEASAASKYESKIIEITGTIQEVYSRGDDQLKIILRDRNVYKGVSCILNEKNKQIKKPLKLGSPITLKGLCFGIDDNVLLRDCVIVKT